jgi:hypothetical protein
MDKLKGKIALITGGNSLRSLCQEKFSRIAKVFETDLGQSRRSTGKKRPGKVSVESRN